MSLVGLDDAWKRFLTPIQPHSYGGKRYGAWIDRQETDGRRRRAAEDSQPAIDTKSTHIEHLDIGNGRGDKADRVLDTPESPTIAQHFEGSTPKSPHI